MIAELLRKLGFRLRKIGPTRLEIEEAIQENAIRDNDKAFESVSQVFKEDLPQSTKALRDAAKRVENNPFSDLENLTRLRRYGKIRGGKGV